MELTQIRFIVRDFARAFRFYRDVMGFSPQVDDDRGPYAKLSLPSGGAAIALHARSDFEQVLGPLTERGDASVVALRVADLDATVRAIRSRGAELVGEPRLLWGRLRAAHLRDPEGNLIELQEWITG